MSISIESALKNLIPTYLYDYIIDNHVHSNSWNDINLFLYNLYERIRLINDYNLFKNRECKIFLACKDQPFVSTNNNNNIHLIANKPCIKRYTIDNSESVNTSQEDLDKVIPRTSHDITLIDVLLKRLQLCRSAERRNLEFNLSDDCVLRLLQRKTCYYTGSRFNNESIHYSKTIDRIDNSIGYIESNVVACTYGVNQLKNRILENPGEGYLLTVKQFKRFASKL